MNKNWRCFHCDQVFTRAVDAREHFGNGPISLPACQIKGHENNLVRVIREQESQLARYRAEDSDILRAMESLRSEHSATMLTAEEVGYDRGVQDMKHHRFEVRVRGITWLLIRHGMIALERCEKKARVLGVGEWFIPGGKLEGDETTDEGLRREFGEEWPAMELDTFRPLPILEGSAVPPGPRGVFLMRPYRVTANGDVPSQSSEGTPVKLFPINEALSSPVLQVRMMTAAALDARP